MAETKLRFPRRCAYRLPAGVPAAATNPRSRPVAASCACVGLACIEAEAARPFRVKDLRRAVDGIATNSRCDPASVATSRPIAVRMARQSHDGHTLGDDVASFRHLRKAGLEAGRTLS